MLTVRATSLARLPVLLAVLLALAAVTAPAAFGLGAGSTQLVSRADGLGPVPPALDNSSATPGALSADGRFAVFVSDADGLAAGLNPRVQNVFVRDRQTGTTTLVSRSDGLDGVGVDSAARNPAVEVQASDGHVLVAFESAATNMTDHEIGAVANPNHLSEVWLRDVTAGTTTLVSRASGASGAPADESAQNPAIADSNGGPLVAFDSQATNLGGTGVFLRTVDAHVTAQVSCPRSDCSRPGPSLSSDPDIRVVPATSGAQCAAASPLSLPCVLVAFVTSDNSIVNVHTGQIMVAVAIAPIAKGLNATPFSDFFGISFDFNGRAGDAASAAPSFSGDGQAVAFLSRATNLGGTPPPGVAEAYVHLLGTTSSTLVSKSTAGDAADEDVRSVALGGAVPSVVAPALRVVFQSAATNLGGTGNQSYVRDIKAAATPVATSLVNRAAGSDGAPGDGVSDSPPAISGDGTIAMFSTDSSNLGDGQVGRFVGVHVRRLSTPQQQVELVSRPSGVDQLVASGSDQSSIPPSGSVVSASGRFVAFDSQSDSLSPIDDNRSTNVFVRDLLTGQTVLVSRGTGANGVPAETDSSVAGISADGRRVAFTSAARNLSPDANGASQAYVRDLDANTTTLVSRLTGPAAMPPAAGAVAEGISSSGNAVVMTSTAPLDPAGAVGVTHVYVRDLAAQKTTLADRDSGPDGAVAAVPSQAPVIDGDGTRVAWVTTAALADAPNDGMQHVYVRDLRSSETTLVSRANGATGASADGNSTSPAIDSAGDVIAFASASPNLGAALTLPQVFARDLAAAGTELISRPVDGGPQLPASADSPSIDAAGDRISFLAFGAVETPPISDFEAFVRDRHDQTTTPVSRADGAGGALGDADTLGSSISASGDCIAFAGPFTNIGDGFASSDFSSVHLRTLRNTCPGAEPTGGPGTGTGTGTGTGGHPVSTTPPPALSALTLSPKRFRLRGKKTVTTIRYTLSQAARVTLRFERLATGHRRGKRCVASGHGKPCTIATTIGTLTINGRPGRNQLRFAGRLNSKALPVGGYRLTATPARGRPRATTFTVLAVRKANGSHH